MKSGFTSFLQRWLINTVAVLIATYFDSGITYENKPINLIVAALILGILNTLPKRLLMLLSAPLLILTLGLFTLVINALLLWIVGVLLRPHFSVAGFGSAFWGAFIISVVSLILNLLTGTSNARVKVKRSQPPPPPSRGDDGGPIIDV